MTVLVTGGAGFIGANFILDWLENTEEPVINLDALTYAGHPGTLELLANDDRHHFVHGSIGDTGLIRSLLREHGISAIVNFAAETHVDRSITGPAAFFHTNTMGTFGLLEACRQHLEDLPAAARSRFRLLHVSTDEVFGSLEPDEPDFTETSPYQPNNPYSASKASADHIARAYWQTFGLPVLVTNCSNNYGPRQYPEKLIPLVIRNALAGRPLPIYGAGDQVRDWLHVRDHCAALRLVLARGRPGERYNIGGDGQRPNIEVVRAICRHLDQRRPRPDGVSYARQISHVADRPGHDRRYGINSAKLRRELGWRPQVDFEAGLAETVDWYLANEDWLDGIAEVSTEVRQRQRA